ncbi:DUF3558 domain-containing protein [Nocardia sp. NPDC050413]|uniref:DUF3558 domain-containing protein n=1 Tax=Nocardia sp. NPDC050413 TaxID=3155784 RepID=UPI00340E8E48
MVKSALIGACVLFALAGSACSSSSGTAVPETAEHDGSVGSTPHARPTLTDAKLQPPAQDNKYTQTSGRPKVVFDPCTWIGAAEIESTGFRSESRRRGPDLVAEYTFLTCIFRNVDNTMSLNVDSGNITWDENLQKNGAWLEATTVNGRRAGLVRNQPGGEDACQVHVETKSGVVIVGSLVLSLGKKQNLDPCTNIMETASVVEKSIGKEN